MCQRCVVATKKESEADNLYQVWEDRAESYLGLSTAALISVLKKDEEEEQGGENFLEPELAMAAAMGFAVYNTGQEAEKIMLSALQARGVVALEDTIEEVRPIMEDAFSSGKTESKIRKAIARAIRTGTNYAGMSPSALDSLATRDDVLEGIVASSKYYTNNYFNKQVIPDIFSLVQEIVATGGDVNTQAYNTVREVMETRLKSVPYWRVVANASASRSYHFGAIKAGMITGRRTYKLSAIIDDRTSEICIYMDGKEFWLPDAERIIVAAATATEEEVKLISPWLPPSDIVGKSSVELLSQGTILPPFHGNCRTTIILT